MLGSTAGLVLTSFLAVSSPALATPSASQLAKEIATAEDQVEQTAEQYNAAQVKLTKDQHQAATLQAQIGPMQLESDMADQSLSTMAAELYMAGPPHSYEILLNSPSSDAIIEQLSLLGEMAQSQKHTIDTANQRISSYQTAKKEQDALVAQDKALVTTLNSKKASINKQLAALKKLQNASSGSSSKTYTKAQLMPAACPASGGSGKGLTAAKKACSIIWQASKSPPWTMYLWGAPNSSNPHRYDCSGLTMTAWAAAGVTLDHYTGDQWTESHGKAWTSSSQSQLEIGDLIFYYSDHHHVAIYVGNGYIAQAPHTGAPLDMSTIGDPSGWGRPS